MAVDAGVAVLVAFGSAVFVGGEDVSVGVGVGVGFSSVEQPVNKTVLNATNTNFHLERTDIIPLSGARVEAQPLVDLFRSQAGNGEKLSCRSEPYYDFNITWLDIELVGQ